MTEQKYKGNVFLINLPTYGKGNGATLCIENDMKIGTGHPLPWRQRKSWGIPCSATNDSHWLHK
jgi:hypothetical protein